MHVDELLGCNDRHASSIVSEVKAPEGGSCLHGCLEHTGSSSALAYRSVEGQGGRNAVMTDPALGYLKDPNNHHCQPAAHASSLSEYGERLSH